MKHFIPAIVALLIATIGSHAFSLPVSAGLLTEDFGILNLSDFDEEGQLSSGGQFPHDSFEHYWQCLKPEKTILKCSADGRSDPEGWINGSATFKISYEGKIYDFGTRRNRDIESCRAMISRIRSLMKKEKVVCLYASYLGETGKTSEWILDRVKTRRGEWSWFARDR